MFTKRDVEGLQYDPAGPTVQIARAEGEPSGFGVRLFRSGVRSYVLDYRTRAGRPRRLTLGKHGSLTLQQARQMAQDALHEVRRGEDPLEDRQDARRGSTVRDLGRAYLDRYAKIEKRSWKEDERRLEKHIYPAFGSRNIGEVRRSDVAELHQKIGERGHYEANRTLALLSVLFAKAEAWGFVPEGSPNPAKLPKGSKFKERKRDRWVMPSEMPALMDAIAEEENMYVRAAFLFALLTGMRRGEILGLQWAYVDIERKEIRLPTTKADRPHVVPLSAPAVALMREIPRQLTRGESDGRSVNPYVFVGSRDGRPLVNVAKAWDRIRMRAGLRDVRIHDLRRTVGSWMAEDGASLPLIGKVLNHSNVSTTAVYARLGEDPARAALERHGARMGGVHLGIAGEGRA